MIALTQEVIDVDAVVDTVRRDAAGAVLVFEASPVTPTMGVA